MWSKVNAKHDRDFWEKRLSSVYSGNLLMFWRSCFMLVKCPVSSSFYRSWINLYSSSKMWMSVLFCVYFRDVIIQWPICKQWLESFFDVSLLCVYPMEYQEVEGFPWLWMCVWKKMDRKKRSNEWLFYCRWICFMNGL